MSLIQTLSKIKVCRTSEHWIWIDRQSSDIHLSWSTCKCYSWVFGCLSICCYILDSVVGEVIQSFSWVRAEQNVIKLPLCKRGLIPWVVTVSKEEKGIVRGCWQRGSEHFSFQLLRGGFQSQRWGCAANKVWWNCCTHSCLIELGDSCKIGNISDKKVNCFVFEYPCFQFRMQWENF